MYFSISLNKKEIILLAGIVCLGYKLLKTEQENERLRTEKVE